MPNPVPTPFRVPLGPPPKAPKASKAPKGKKLPPSLFSPAHPKSLNRPNRQDPLANLAPTRGPQGAVPRSHAHLASGIAHGFTHAADVTYHASPLPSAFDAFAHPGNEALQRKDIARQKKDFSSVAEATTGYKEIRHIRHHPIAGGIALASDIIPGFGKLGRGIELGVEAARSAEAARGALTAEDVTRATEQAAHTAEGTTGLKRIAANRKVGKISRLKIDPASAHADYAQKVDEANQRAFAKQDVPRLEEGQVSPETGGEAGGQIRSAMKGAERDYSRQKKLQKAELRTRVAKLSAEEKKATTLIELAHARGLGGKYSTVPFRGFDFLKGAPKYPEGTLFHGSPEGHLGDVDALYHTKMWQEGPGFYLTTDAAKAAKYAAGKTASTDRKLGQGAVNAFRLKPGAKVLNLDKQPESFWRGIASKIFEEPVSEKTWKEWARDIPSGKTSEGVTNRIRLLHLLTGWGDIPKTDAYYAIEEALHNEGVQATLHHENGVPVWVVKDESALEKVAPPGSFSEHPALPSIKEHIDQLPMSVLDKRKLAGAIVNGINGDVPKPFERKLIERAFGKLAAEKVAAAAPGGLGHNIVDILNIPRAFKTAGDFSWGLRQGLVALAYRPSLWAKELGPMFHSAISEAETTKRMAAIHADPETALGMEHGLAITDPNKAGGLGSGEEGFQSQMAERLHELPGIRSTPGVKHVAKVVSTGVRMSDRAYVVPLNEIRLNLFKHLTQLAADNGHHLNDQLLHDIADIVNTFTGRGNLGPKLAEHRATINAVFFSPGLMKSRINMLNPAHYYRLEPFARQQQLKAARNLAGSIGLMLYLARLAGAQVVTDPRNSDFGKIRVGNTRVDLGGGFNQYLTLASRIATQQTVSSTSGKATSLSGKYGGQSDWDVLQNFFANKTSPVLSEGISIAKQNRFGQPLTPTGELGNMFAPLLWSDMAQIAKSKGPGGGPIMAGATLLPDLFGVGVQNYGPPKKKGKTSTPFGSGKKSKSSSPFGSGTSSSGDPFGP